MLIYIFWVLGKYKPYGILVEPVTQTSCWKTILLHRSGNLSVDLKSCCFDRLNLVSVIGTSDIIKWPGKISFQSNFTLEQQLLLLHLTFLEFQKNEVSHRKRINVCNNFCVWMCTHVRFQPPIPNLGNCIRHFRNCSLVFWTFPSTCRRHKWMAVKPKIVLLIDIKWERGGRWWEKILKSNEQDLWIERVRGQISYLVLTSHFENFRPGFFCTTVQTNKNSF